MAAIEINANKKSKVGNKKLIKKSTNVDLTPMVDLGFLLITFFMFTSSMQQPKALKLNTPISNVNDSIKVKGSATLTLMLHKQNLVYAYIGLLKADASNVLVYNYNNLRYGINEFKNGIDDANKKFMNVIIKPSDSCTTANLVDVLDEMVINSITCYAKVEMKNEELLMVDALARK